MARLKNKKVSVIENIDINTGEVERKTIVTSSTFNTRVKNEDFYIVFLESISDILRIKSGLTRRVLDILCIEAEFNKGTIDLTEKKREKLCKKIGIKRQTLYNHLSLLKRMGIISIIKGECKLNSKYFWKGELKVRKESVGSILYINNEDTFALLNKKING